MTELTAACSSRKSAGAHAPKVHGKLRINHQLLATLEALQGVLPEVIDRIAIGMLDQTPERPEQIAHGFVDDDPSELGGARLPAEISPDHLFVLPRVESALDRQVA